MAARGARAAGRAHATHRRAYAVRGANDTQGQARNAAFLQGLVQLGWVVGRNLLIDYRWTTGHADDIRRNAAELIALAPDAILAPGTATVGPLLQATRNVPVVFVNVADPVGAGYADSLARPGGNATGFLLFEFGISGKWLELLKEIAPNVTRAVLAMSLSASALAFGACGPGPTGTGSATGMPLPMMRSISRSM